MSEEKQHTIVRDVVYSPDDGGYYAQETDLDVSKSRVSRRIYTTEHNLQAALARSTHKWEAWS